MDIDYEVCDSCGKCVSACSKGVLQAYSLESREYIAPIRWFLCDGCGGCVEACDRKAIQTGPFSPSFERHAIHYFKQPGPRNTLQIFGCEVIGVGGTRCGADTAIVMKATLYQEMLSGPLENRFNIVRIIAAPSKKRWYW